MSQHIVEGLVARVSAPHFDGTETVVSFTLTSDADRRIFVGSVQEFPELVFLRSGDAVNFYAAQSESSGKDYLWIIHGWLQNPSVW